MLLLIAAAAGVVCLGASTLATARFLSIYRRLPEEFPQQLGWDGELIGVASRQQFVVLWVLFAVVWLSSVVSAGSALFLAGPGQAHDPTVTLSALATIIFAVSSIVLLVNTAAVTQNAMGRPLRGWQKALFCWSFRCSLGVALGIVYVMASLAYRISLAG